MLHGHRGEGGAQWLVQGRQTSYLFPINHSGYIQWFLTKFVNCSFERSAVP